MDEQWDGVERRQVSLIAEKLKPKTNVQVPLMAVVIGFVAVVALQIGGLWGHSVVDSHLLDKDERDRRFQQSVSCFLVQITRPNAETSEENSIDVLTKCGLLGAVGPVLPEE